jgi:hypothetical protein
MGEVVPVLTKHYAMKAYGGVDKILNIHSFNIIVADKERSSNLRVR